MLPYMPEKVRIRTGDEPAKAPEIQLYSLLLCTKCGCIYCSANGSCPEHGAEFMEASKR